MLKKENLPLIESGRPLCPKDGTPFKYAYPCRGKGRTPRDKWECPKITWVKGKRVCTCEDPCTSSPSGRMVYTYPHQDLRTYPGIIRDSDEWNTLYDLRCKVEQNIQYFKEPMAVGSPKTRDRLTIKADVYLAGITQLVTVILADLLNKPEHFRSLRPLIA